MNPLVSIISFTYNHEKFIRQALDSFVMQKTNFEFEIIVHDDASTDNTQKIIKEYENKYPNLFRPIYQTENQKSKGNGIVTKITFGAARGKYFAQCEGDDYWTDPYKLQKQVDFLESNPDYGLVHGDVNLLFANTGKVVYAFNKTNKITIPEGNIFEDLMYPSHMIKTMTVCLRRKLMMDYIENYKDIAKSWLLGDLPLWLEISRHSKIHYIDEVLATYRLSDESVSRSNNIDRLHQFNLSVYNVRFYFAKKYNCSQKIHNAISIHYNRMLLNDSFLLNDKKMALNAIIFLLRKRKVSIKKLFHFISHFYFKYK